ncbi:uncharacterized protein N7482_006261 [Penicillium canariense]|uniref:ADP-ribose 1''-phosphate phosphatase n=1 Tax=Penicillium canariense TaxID=189055 RepID=A0A9W9I6G4_9EURO|nr:uncharacterized protein N7482_006261 [Penicillium canariense]KAJ5167480.1 hypothetical protein N7482_006261 [Penicillium canariense]
MPGADTSTVNEIPGDLFDAPEGSGLIHACNTQGNWGAGIARAFKQRYPAAFQYYRDHCLQFVRSRATHDIIDLQDPNESTVSVRLPVGTTLIIPPQPADIRSGQKKQWVICLFTSQGFGRRVDSPDLITNCTYSALKDLKDQIARLRQQLWVPMPDELYSCRFNSGLFAVPWEQTRQLVEDVGLPMTVVYPPEEFEAE